MKTIIDTLRIKCIPELAKKYSYFSIHSIQSWFKKRGIDLKIKTLKDGRLDLIKEKIVFKAGYGWLSTIKQEYSHGDVLFSDIILGLKKEFPFMDFSLWSTEQIKGYTHHTLAKFVIFVNVPDFAMSDVYNFLHSFGVPLYLNPTVKEVEKGFRLEKRTIVIRPSVKGQEGNGYLCPMETILVDLFLENRKLNLISPSDFDVIFSLIATQNRLLVSKLFSYAARRAVPLDKFLRAQKRTFSDIDFYCKKSAYQRKLRS